MQLGKRPKGKGNPKTLKRVGKTKYQSPMRTYISFRIWKIKLSLTIEI